MNTNLATKPKRALPLPALLLFILVYACSDKNTIDTGTSYDPSQPVSISRIAPDSGALTRK
ncbi:hypothetical protein [Paraflavitalea speifideaquila]|uniref:hypothetical protein n=1 Tax=Paraflavitalea speifideaquila TaxID=3076558 RepID=UPI0028EFA638|nr:hypothetical protein [Paraflavitalea speifideiaquila]